MSNFEAIIDIGSKNLRLGIFDNTSKNIYSSEQQIEDRLADSGLERSLNILIRNAEKYLSSHIDNVVVLYDSPKIYSLDVSIKKTFDYSTSLKKVYDSLIEEAHYLVSQNNFKDEIIHLVINNIIINNKKILKNIIEDIKIKSLILEIKFICLNKSKISKISNILKRSNLKILNLYCSSYVKTFCYKNKLESKDYVIFLDIGYEKTCSLIFNNDKFEFFNSIPLGGNDITKDISKVLNLNYNYSEDLKLKFNNNKNNLSFNKSSLAKNNIYSEIIEKNISIDLLKQIIGARMDEIIDLVLLKSSFIKNTNPNVKPKLVIMGGGAKVLSYNYKLCINKLLSNLNIFYEHDLNICEAGFKYHKSDESFLTKTKKKTKKQGFFETFFNLFSK